MMDENKEAVEMALQSAAAEAQPVVKRFVDEGALTLPPHTVGLDELRQLASALSSYLKLDEEE